MAKVLFLALREVVVSFSLLLFFFSFLFFTCVVLSMGMGKEQDIKLVIRSIVTLASSCFLVVFFPPPYRSFSLPPCCFLFLY